MLKTLEKLGVTKQQIYGKNRGMKNYKTISNEYCNVFWQKDLETKRE